MRNVFILHVHLTQVYVGTHYHIRLGANNNVLWSILPDSLVKTAVVIYLSEIHLSVRSNKNLRTIYCQLSKQYVLSISLAGNLSLLSSTFQGIMLSDLS